MDNGKIVRVRTSRNAHLAVTQYRVLSSTLSSALVELQPVTGEGPTALQWAEKPHPGPCAGLRPSPEQLVFWGLWDCTGACFRC